MAARNWSVQRGGHRREFYTRVNVWTVCQKKMAVVKWWPFQTGGGHKNNNGGLTVFDAKPKLIQAYIL